MCVQIHAKVTLHQDMSTHPFWVKVLFDGETVHHTGGRQTALHAGNQHEEQGQLGGFHPVIKLGEYVKTHHNTHRNIS